MTTTTCDCCASAIDSHGLLNKEFTAILHMRRAIGRFRFAIEIGCFEFNMTDKHFCSTCLLNAVKQSLSNNGTTHDTQTQMDQP